MNSRLPLTTPVISYPAPLPLTSRLPSVCTRWKVPHSSESHVPFTLIAAGSFCASSHALPSASPLTAVREVGKEIQSNNNAAAIVSRFIQVLLRRTPPGRPYLLLDHEHGLMFGLLLHKASGVRTVEVVVVLRGQFRRIVDFAFMGEEQEDLLAADDASDIPTIAISGHVSAALRLNQDNLAPFLCVPVAVDIDCGRLAMGIEPRFALSFEIPRTQANSKSKNHANWQ